MRRILLIGFMFIAVMVSSSWAAERLVVKDDAGAQKFTVTDQGWVGINTITPQAEIDLGGGGITLAGNDDSGFVTPRLYWFERGRIDFGYGGPGGGNLEAYSSGHADRQGQFRFVYGGGDYGSVIFTHYDGSHWKAKMTLDYAGRLTMSGGAYCDGYSWVNASSRDYKENIEDLTTADALQVLEELKPVSFSYKTDKNDTNLGFIAEDVPDFVATKDRKGTNAMDFVAVLTRVAQEQQKQIAELKTELSLLKQRVSLSDQ